MQGLWLVKDAIAKGCFFLRLLPNKEVVGPTAAANLSKNLNPSPGAARLRTSAPTVRSCHKITGRTGCFDTVATRTSKFAAARAALPPGIQLQSSMVGVRARALYCSSREKTTARLPFSAERQRLPRLGHPSQRRNVKQRMSRSLAANSERVGESTAVIRNFALFLHRHLI